MFTQSKIIIVLLLVISLLGYFSYTQVQRVGEVNKELETSELRVDTLQSSINKLEEDRKRVRSKVTNLIENTNEQKRELASLRNREDIVVAKPGLIELKINKAFKDTQETLACETGDTRLCE